MPRLLPLTAALGLALLAACSRDAAQPAAPAAAAPAATLPAEGLRVAGTQIVQHVNSVGTLLARESVTIVSESDRRLVKVACTEGALVEKGELLFQLDDAELQAELHRLEIRRRNLSDTAQRQRDLFAANTTSRQEFDRAQADLDVVAAEIARLQIDIAKTTIRAPFAGIVGLRRESEGAFVTKNTRLTTLQDLSALRVDFTLPERYADEVKPGLPFTFSVASSALRFEGRITAIEPQIDATTRSLVVRGLVPNPERRLIPGAFANIELSLAPTDDGILIPTSALVASIKGQSVWLAIDGKAVLREVKTGLRTEDDVQIVSGLKPGDLILVSNLLRLRPGAAVQVLEPRR